MRSLPRLVFLYIAVLAIGVLCALGVTLDMLPRSPRDIGLLAAFALCVCLSDLFPIELPYWGNAEITISGAVKTASALLFGPAAALWIACFGTLLAEIIMRRQWHKMIFNTAQMTLTFGAMAWIYQRFSNGTIGPFASIQNFSALLLILLTYYVLNLSLLHI